MKAQMLKPDLRKCSWARGHLRGGLAWRLKELSFKSRNAGWRGGGGEGAEVGAP